ncbi:Hsp70 family protein [Rhizobium sp. RM]|uniref:Hsp70 family protein n=1 Tax=Rhizobium sp. RM TaxID=2748079 RepID=UPI00110E7D31|nr:Hsp70 family protein [Rhizobium sp. RM]NWJ27154.1 Hsp70 family protein [Rhizobium sp. RM]TMV20218.1 hypothetical protein BJG94_09320 [Rhizobium sp. Td3]
MRAGLFVGVAEYSDPRIPSLSYADADARKARGQFIKTSSFDKEAAVCCTSDNNQIDFLSSRSTIFKRLDAFEQFRNGPPLEAFVFYFSGHGFRSDQGQDYLIPQDAVYGALPETSISLATLIRKCCEINAKTILVFIDACRDNFNYPAATEPLIPLISFAEGSNLAVFFSTDARAAAREHGNIEGGVFTYCLSEALELEFDCRRLHELGDFLARHVPSTCARLRIPSQTPVSILGDNARDFVLPISKLSDRLYLPPWVGREVKLRQEETFLPDFPLPVVIDFGTTKSILAYGTASGYEFIRDGSGKICMPSTVRFFGDGNYEVGVDHFSGVTSRYAKRRLLSRVFEDAADDKGLRPDQYAMLVIRSLIDTFQHTTGTKARRCVLSIPTDYNILDVSRIVDCVQATGVRVERIIPEPTAAAFNVLSSFQTGQRASEVSYSDKHVLVVDMGGGTLDVAVVYAKVEDIEWELEDDALSIDLNSEDALTRRIEFKVLASSGDAKLGGIDFDLALKDFVVGLIKSRRLGVSPVISYSELSLEREVERAKVALSTTEAFTISLEDVEFAGGVVKPLHIEVTRKDLNDLTINLFKRYVKCVEDCISFAREHDDIIGETNEEAEKTDVAYKRNFSSIMLAGQSGRVDKIRRYLTRTIPDAVLNDYYCETAVARGMAEITYSRLHIEVDDIAHSYVGVSGLRRTENAFIVDGSSQNHSLIYPTDNIPASRTINLHWPDKRFREITITTHTIGKTPISVCKISLDDSALLGTNGLMRISMDEMFTVVVELRTARDNCAFWQINNFFRIPVGYQPSDTLDSGGYGIRRLQKAASFNKDPHGTTERVMGPSQWFVES